MKIIIGIVVMGLLLTLVFKVAGLGPMIALGFALIIIWLIKINETLDKYFKKE